MISFTEAVQAFPATMALAPSLAATDPRQANSLIEKGYGELSVALGRFLHADQEPENATFATFAAWTSRTLRVDVDPGASTRRPLRRLYDGISDALLPDPGVIARNIAIGQAAIFGETGAAMWALLEATARAREQSDHPDWMGAWKCVTARLKDDAAQLAGSSTTLLGAPDVKLLQDALIPYFEVLWSGLSTFPTVNPGGDRDIDAGRKRRAELILLGNLRLVAYEQRRLQPVLERNLRYLPLALRLKLITRWTGRPTLVSNAVTRAYVRVKDHLDVLDRGFEIAATRYVYSLILGAEDLRFGLDLPLPPPAHPVLREDQPDEDQDRYADGDFFPYHLQVIDDARLWAEWQLHDRSAGQGAHTSVDNWLRLPERLNFIANVFRSRQQVSALYDLGRVGEPASPDAAVAAVAAVAAESV